MYKKIILYLFVIIIIGFVLFSMISYGSDSGGKTLPIENGIIDISDWYENNEDILMLNGKWAFYWNKLVTYQDIQNAEEPDLYPTVPKVWNKYLIDGKSLPGFGYGTYKLHVTGAKKGSTLSFWIPTFSTAYRFYINNDLIASSGTVSTNKENGKPQYAPKQVTYTATADNFDILIQVSNYTYSRGGMWYSVYLGTPEQILHTKESVLSRDLFFLGCFVVMCFIYGSIYMLRKKEKSNLYFALLCITAICRTAVHGYYFINILFPDLPFGAIIRIDYLAMIWYPVLIALMIKEMYLDIIRQKLLCFCVIYNVIISLIVLTTPVSFFTGLIYIIEFMVMVFSLYMLVEYIIAIINKQKVSLTLFAGGFFIFAAGCYDLLFENTILAGGFIELTPMGFFIMLVLQSYVFAKQFTETLEKKEQAMVDLQIATEKERKAELKFLKSQIHPHFIYNALNTIISISRTDLPRAQELLIEFSNYLRGCFDFKDLENMVPIQKELDFIRSYISLQQARFGEHLQVHYEINTLNIMIPPLILQPLVENAVNHGVRPKPNGGTIIIYTKTSEKGIRIGVRDDGYGIDPDRIPYLIAGNEVSRGVGIFNITSRLQKLYGKSLCIENLETGGLDVYMELPHLSQV